jgi:hypothetical protein
VTHTLAEPSVFFRLSGLLSLLPGFPEIVFSNARETLKNRNTLNWKIVNALKKRFLLLLTATPVENNLIELHNLVTLLKPGQLKTAAEFKREFMNSADPTDPRNREALKALLGQIMIRNTRAVAKIDIPPRFAQTVKVECSESEKSLYVTITSLVRTIDREDGAARRLFLKSLLEEAGSSPRAVALSLSRLLTKRDGLSSHEKAIREACNQCLSLEDHSKHRVLLKLLTHAKDKIILMQDEFSFRKALCWVTSTAAIRTDYLCLTCRYEARSDEQKEGLLSFSFHVDTGAMIPFRLETLIGGAAEISPLHDFSRKENKWERIIQVLPKAVEPAIEEEIREFRESMNRRLRRDTANVEEYYGTLKKEMELGLGRAGLSARLVQDRKERIALILEELAKKMEDLLQKYSVRVKVMPAAALLVRTPAVRVLCDVHIGREKRPLSLTYNPLTKALDPLACDGCGGSTTEVSFCSRYHALCPRCAQSCPACGL